MAFQAHIIKVQPHRRDEPCQSPFPARPNRRFQFQKRSQLFFRAHEETLSVDAMRVCNPDRSRFSLHTIALEILRRGGQFSLRSKGDPQ